jgi:polyphosphate kinase
MRLARDAEMEFDDEGGRTQLELVERELKRRRRSDVVRLELEASSSPELVGLRWRPPAFGSGFSS